VPTGLPAIQIPVANLDRDVVVETEAAPSLQVSRRGHVMLMSNDANIRGAAFVRLGRTDKHIPIRDPVFDQATFTISPGANPRARYALHFHEAGCDLADLAAPARVEESVVEDAIGWGFVNHSSTVRFVRNVAYDFVGAGFVAEDGDEAGAFDGNLAIGGKSTGSGPNVPESNPDLPEESMKFVREMFSNLPRITIGDMGFGGHGFWFQGPDLTVVNNISCGNKGAGFVYWASGKFDPATHLFTGFPVARLPAGSDPQVFDYAPALADINQVAVREFSQNRAFANFIGLKIRFSHGFGNAPRRVGTDFNAHLVGQPAFGPSLIASSTFWDNRIGLLASYTRMNFRDLLIVGPPPDQQVSINYQPSIGLIVRGPHVLDFVAGVRIRGYNEGAYDEGCDRPDGENTSLDAEGLRIDGDPVDVTTLPPCGP
jgi:hypothetical protein